MQRYFLPETDLSIQKITGDDAHHIKNVMRMSPGTDIIICDGHGHSFQAVLETIVPEITYTIKHQLFEDTELPLTIILGQGLPKSDKFEHIIQKCTELGVSDIIPVMMRRSIAKIEQSKEEKKLLRWRKIAKEAAEQSRRLVVPNIHSSVTIQELVEMDADHRLVAYEMHDATQPLKKVIKTIKPKDKIIIVIGPEGGIDSQEITLLEAAGFTPVNLGKRILRTETAAAHVVSILSYYTEGD